METNGILFKEKLAYPYANFSIRDYSKPSPELKKENCSSNSEGIIPSEKEIATTKKNILELNIETGEELTMACCESGTNFSTDGLLNFSKDFLGISSFISFFVSLYLVILINGFLLQESRLRDKKTG